MMALSARPTWVSWMSEDLAHNVFASRLNSCARKSSLRPAGSCAATSARASWQWAESRSSSSLKSAREVAAETGLAPARVDGLLALKGVIVQDDPAMIDDVGRAARDACLLESLAGAFDALVRARRNEGAKLGIVLEAEMGEIARLTAEASRLAARQLPQMRERLEAQLDELIASNKVPEERLAQEAALLALRADVREELDRLNAHVEEARHLLRSGEAIGRKLDFLAQEFNREANTLCSKSADIALTQVGLALKAAIDRFREQAQNVE